METMNEQEARMIAIEKFTNIQRIKKYGKEEIDYQEKIIRAELESLKISVEDLELK